MSDFELDTRLKNDCFVLGELELCQLLLMNNALVPWFILVPKTTKIEIMDLTQSDQATLLQEINLVSPYLKNHFNISKLNIAAIGNIVNQLHIHIVGRHPEDYCWPNVVWGTREKEPYADNQVTEIKNSLGNYIGSKLRVF